MRLPSPETNIIRAKNDYRVLQPYEVADQNQNQTHVAFDALGNVVGTALIGGGDSSLVFDVDLDDATIKAQSPTR